jgi:hypothetical protein
MRTKCFCAIRFSLHSPSELHSLAVTNFLLALAPPPPNTATHHRRVFTAALLRAGIYCGHKVPLEAGPYVWCSSGLVGTG